MTIILNDDKKKKIEELVKSFKALDDAIEPFRAQKTELRKEYIDNKWLDKEEYDMAKKAYNALKSKIDMEDLSSMIDLIKGQIGEE